MRERPILFSAPMVRAILAGTKTQDRRVVKGKHRSFLNNVLANFIGGEWDNRPLPYGKPGDRLWVREACRADELPDGLDGVRYLADYHFEPIKNTKGASDSWVSMHHYRGGKSGGMIGPVVPPVHMPRWASRITLEITGVRVERLQDISEADAIAEGVYTDPACPAYNSYAMHWESSNGPWSWDANPWVWVIEFKRI